MRTRVLAVAAVCFIGCEQATPPTHGGILPPISGSTGYQHRAIELSGGTLVIAGGGRFAVASDPDNDRLWVVDLSNGTLRGKIVLPDGSQPQRLVEDGSGRVRVALRGSGQVATVSASQMSVLGIEEACPEVRGITWSKSTSSLLVACAGGELVTLGSSGRTVATPATDLRDVVEARGKLWVSRFRAANLVEVAADGTGAAQVELPSVGIGGTASSFVPAVAWRTISASDGRIFTVHQRVVDGSIGAIQVPAAPPARPYYQNTCASSIVHSTVSVLDDGKVTGSADIAGVLPIDLAISPDNQEMAIAQPGSRQVQRLAISAVTQGVRGGICAPNFPDVAPVGQVTGVAYTPQNSLVVHTREPSAVWILGPSQARSQKQILLTGATVSSPGHALFHDATGAIACASCHPEGGDDGHVWTLFSQTVRTQSLAGGVIETAPFHWSGAIPNLQSLLDDTFVTRMGAAPPTSPVVASLSSFMESIPRPKVAAPAAMDVMEHGRTLFNDAAIGCSNCHSGEALTNNTTVDVGTGGRFQVPSLRGVSLRGPWMHDGCAATLKDRFGPCGGKSHGNLAGLAPGDIDALVSYLGTL